MQFFPALQIQLIDFLSADPGTTVASCTSATGAQTVPGTPNYYWISPNRCAIHPWFGSSWKKTLDFFCSLPGILSAMPRLSANWRASSSPRWSPSKIWWTWTRWGSLAKPGWTPSSPTRRTSPFATARGTRLALPTFVRRTDGEPIDLTLFDV